MRRACTAPGAVLIGLLALSGCGWISSSSSKSTAEACPSAVILRPLANNAVFGPAPERRPDNVAFYGLISEADLKCEHTGDAVRMIVDVVVVAERGPAAKADSVDFQYFVALIGPDQSILYKKILPVRIVFDATGKRAGVTDHVEDAIPLGGRKATDLTVDLGFQQSPEVVDFYKHFRGR
ncbi:MAG: hypothetical protein JO282_10915 [Alphaproteobacteria bacterium]|nr:hypothetical protein [Alphaproteobacteria bacterium]